MSFLRFMPVSDCVQERPVLIFQKLQAVEHYQYHRHLFPHPRFAICLERDFLGYFIYFSFHKILLWYTLPATEVRNTNISSFHYPLLTPDRDGGAVAGVYPIYPSSHRVRSRGFSDRPNGPSQGINSYPVQLNTDGENTQGPYKRSCLGIEPALPNAQKCKKRYR